MKALIFDLDGTLVDSVYAHTIAWQQALREFGIEAPAYQIQRRVGLSGRLLARGIGRLIRQRLISERDLHIWKSVTPPSSVSSFRTALLYPVLNRSYNFCASPKLPMASPRLASALTSNLRSRSSESTATP
jgi:beta-phosphoglucomutase-like phosphatase (HAD superfamily)